MAQKHVKMDDKATWDDSALINSWNDALKEYQKYHSIHAKGGSLRDLQQEHPSTVSAPETGLSRDAPVATTQMSDAPGEETVAKDEGDMAPSNQDELPDASSTGQNGLPQAPNNTAHHGPAVLAPPMNLGSIQDENIKRLLMSWYYAGYYTGLYQASQQT